MRSQVPAAAGMTVGAGLVTAGVAVWSTAAALIVAGVFVVLLSMLLLVQVGEQ